jgi:hypothetical protein
VGAGGAEVRGLEKHREDVRVQRCFLSGREVRRGVEASGGGKKGG